MLYEPGILFLSIYAKQMYTDILHNTGIRIFIATLFELVKNWKQPKYPLIVDWLNNVEYYTKVETCCYRSNSTQQYE